MHKTLTLLFIMCGFWACSSSKPTVGAPVAKRLTPQEAARARLLEKYRLMRIKAAARHHQNSRVIKIIKLERKKVSPVVTGRPQKKIRIVDFQKRQKEIDQNLTYYCIKYESSYSDQSKCLEYANEKLVDCEVQAINNNSISVIRCLKRKLRIR